MAVTAVFAKTWNGTVATTVTLVSFSRWQYLRVSNLAASANVFVTTNGAITTTDQTAGNTTVSGATTPAAGADGGWMVGPGQTLDVPVMQPFWWQGFGGPGGSIDPIGLKNPSIDVNAPANSTNAPNPGTPVTIVASASSTVLVEGVG